MPLDPSIKKELYNLCVGNVERRINLLQQTIQAATDAVREETKSSAGDKYETMRAMLHLEVEKNQVQLEQALKSKRTIDEINPDSRFTTAQLGACVITNSGNYYLAISVGKVQVESNDYMIISPVSPIRKLISGLKKGDSYSFRNESPLVLEVI